MSGVQMALLGAGGTILTSGSGSYSGGKFTFYLTGFVSSSSYEYVVAGSAFGAMTAPYANGAQIVALYTSNPSNGTYQAYIEVTGNRSSGFINSVTYNGTSFGSIGTYTYNSSTNTTTIKLGSAGSTNPIPSPGTYVIVVT